MSQVLSTKTGFLPIAMPITEPAVGLGLGVGLAFFHDKPKVVQTPDGPRVIPPSMTALFGMATDNGSYAVGAGHLHVFDEGRIRYLVGGGYGSLNLDWFGQGDAFGGRSVSYNIEAVAFLQKLTFKIGDSDFFAGPTQRFLKTSSSFASDRPEHDFGILPDELDATVSGVGAFVGYDTRNSLFSPTKGTKASIAYTQNDKLIGSDFDYGRLDLEICQYIPLGGPFTLGLRGQASFCGDDAPFFDLASVDLRGIQKGRYEDDFATTLEAELRWDLTNRWTLVGFGGAGWTADKFDKMFDDAAHYAGGTGVRYLIARQFDLRMGFDIARGPEEWTFYVTVGTGWLRD